MNNQKFFGFISALVVTVNCYAAPPKEFMLAIGEQKELQLSPQAGYAIGNKDVLASRLETDGRTLRFRGKKIGFSDIVLTTPTGQRTHHVSVFVVPKRKLLKLKQAQAGFAEIGLKAEVVSDTLVVRGKLSSLTRYRIFQALKRQYRKLIRSSVIVATSLQKLILQRISDPFMAQGREGLKCTFYEVELFCSAPFSLSKKEKTFLRSFWFANTRRVESKEMQSNFRVELRIYQAESEHAEALSLGLYGAHGSLAAIISKRPNLLWSDNTIMVENQEVSMQTLAAPSLLVRPGKSSEIRVGGEISFQGASILAGETIQALQWKFSGFRFKLKLHHPFKTRQLALDYKSQFARPNQVSMAGSMQKGSLNIVPGKIYKIFDVTVSTEGMEKTVLPIIEHIPILRTIFSKERASTGLKSIFALLRILPETDASELL